MESKHELEKITWGVIPVTVYRGCLITKLIGGYEILGTRVSKPEDVDEVIDKAGTILNESIDRGGITVKGDNGSFSCIGGVNSGDSPLVGDNLSDLKNKA